MHGCVDGFSRVVVYLACNVDNTSATVLDLFRNAIASWGLPSRVRGDMGVQNRDVARFMLFHEARDPGGGSYITGRSVHNCRIERLWRDVYQSVLSVFYDVFMGMEFDGVLDPDNENHIFCLHEVYKPTTNKMLNRFTDSWQNHKLRTARNKSPLQLFILGMQQIGRETGVLPNEYFETLTEPDIESYGFDGKADLPEEIDASEAVVVPETVCPLDEEALAIFRERLHFVQDEDLGNTQPYLHALQILAALINNA